MFYLHNVANKDAINFHQILMVEGLRSIHPQTSDISRILVGNKIADHWDVVGTAPVGAAPTTSLYSK